LGISDYLEALKRWFLAFQLVFFSKEHFLNKLRAFKFYSNIRNTWALNKSI